MDMERPFAPVPDRAALDALFAESRRAPILLYLHDPFCGISARAHRELAQLPPPVHLVDVARQHDLSRAIAQRTGVRHESPQVFVLRDGRAAWSASHHTITAAAVSLAVAAEGLMPTNAPPPRAPGDLHAQGVATADAWESEGGASPQL